MEFINQTHVPIYILEWWRKIGLGPNSDADVLMPVFIVFIPHLCLNMYFDAIIIWNSILLFRLILRNFKPSS
jgi:hypothetical protein